MLGDVRKKLMYKILAFSFLFNYMLGVSLPSCADFLSGLREQKNKIAKKMREQRQKIRKERSFQKNIKLRVNQTEKEIDLMNASIEKMSKQIEDMKKEIAELEKSRSLKLEEIKKLKEKLKKFVRLMYMGKIPNSYEMILGSSNFNNFIDRTQSVKYVNSKFLNIKNKIKEEINDINNTLQEIERLNYKCREAIKNYESQKINLNNKIENLDKLYEESRQNQERIQCELDEENEKLKQIDSDIDRYYRSILKNNNNGSGVSYIPKFSGNKPRLMWPVKGFTKITSNFYDAYQRKKSHGAIDIGRNSNQSIYGQPVRAPIDMVITCANYGYNGGYGNLVTAAFEHNGKSYMMYFGHLSKVSTVKGVNVPKGSIIGNVGSTGFSNGPHLHFEIRENGKRIDPLTFAYDY